MGTKMRRMRFVAAALAVALAGGAYFAHRQRTSAAQSAAAHIAAWPEKPRMLAQIMMERYGAPELAPGAVTWHERGPWKRVSVRAGSPGASLEQTVGYRGTYLAVKPLSEFGHGVRIDLDDNELSCASDDESQNRLALNLADEVASGKRGPREAAEFYAKTIKLAAAGKSSPYMTDIQFAPYRPAPEEAWRKVIGF